MAEAKHLFPTCDKHVCPEPGTLPVCFCPTPGLMKLKDFKVQYAKLEDDVHGKDVEIKGLRDENDMLRLIADKAAIEKEEADRKIKECEQIMKQIRQEGAKMSIETVEKIAQLKEKLAAEEKRYNLLKEERKEFTDLVIEQNCMIKDYILKIRDAECLTENQKERLKTLHEEANVAGSKVTHDLQEIKRQFQERIYKLQPMTEQLRKAQIELADAQGKHLAAEKENMNLERELTCCKDKEIKLKKEFTSLYVEMAAKTKEKEMKFEGLKRRYQDLKYDFEALGRLKVSIDEEMAYKNNLAEKQKAEILELQKELEEAKTEAADVLLNTKERCECVRRAMQMQLSQKELLVAHARAVLATAERDRSKIHNKIEFQIENLMKNFDDTRLKTRYMYEKFENMGLNAKAVESDSSCSCGDHVCD